MSYSSEVTSRSPLGYWKFDEAGVVPATDSSGTANWTYASGVTGSLTALTADGGTCVHGSGTAPIATFGSVPSGLSGANVTLEAWISIPSGNTKGSIVKVGSGSNGWGMGLGNTQWDNVGRKLILLSEAVAWHPTSYTFPAGAGTYHVMVVRGASGAVTAYVNGTSVWSGTLTSPITATTQMGVGGYTETYGFKLDSAINVDNVALFASALSSGRVTAHYNSGSGDNAAVLADSPVAFLKFDEALPFGYDGLSAADSSGNSRHLTHVGSPSLGLTSLLAGGVGKSIGYNGSSQASTRATATWMDATVASAVVRINVDSAALTGQQFVASRWQGGNPNNAWLWSINAGKPEITVYAASANHTVTAPSNISTGQHTLGWSYNGTTLKLYVDGASVGSLSITGALPTGLGAPLEVARAALAAYGAVKLDEFAFFGTALSDADHLAIHTAAVPAAAINLAPPQATATALAPAPKPNLFLLSPKATATALALTAALTFGAAPLPFNPPPATATAAAPAPGMVVGPFGFAVPAASAVAAAPAPAITFGAFEFAPPPARAAATALAPSINVAGSPLEYAAPTATATALAPAPTVAVPVHAVPWTADLSQRTLLPFVASGSGTFVPPLAAIPPSIVERPLIRRSAIVPDLTGVAGTRVDARTKQITVPDRIYDAFPVTRGVVGVPHIIIDGRDVTYFRNARTQVREDQAMEPFGDARLVVDFPQVSTLDDPENPALDLAWMRNGAVVHYVMQRWDVDGPTGAVDTLFHGQLVSDDSGNDDSSSIKSWSATGTLYTAAQAVWQTRVMVNAVDRGVQIAKAINSVPSRRFPKVAAVTTGITTIKRGEPSGKIMQYAQMLLSDMYDSTGRQWTVAKKPGSMNRYEVRKKKTGNQWTVTNGQRGLKLSLSADSTQSRNVIWGRGQRSDGGVWMNKKYPETGRTAPAYPYSSPGSVMSIGSTDAGTVDGDGVSKWQRRAKALGFRVTVDGVFSSADADVARQLQRHYGILVDGIVGPQTWAETFDVGALGADPDGWVRLPLAWLPGTQKYLYRANGSVIGLDPDYDPSIVIVSDDIDFGTDITLAQGIKSAQQIIDRENPPALSGTAVLECDPREGSRLDIQAGDRITVIGYEGRDVTFYIADRGRGWQGKRTVTLQVAEKDYDALTLAQIRNRNAESRVNVGRKPGAAKSKPVIDPWDCESNAGHVERFALYGGLWTVIRVPMSEVGRIAQLDAKCSAATEFSIFMFAKQVTSSQMIRYVGGNPKVIADPGSDNRELLDDRFGWIQGWGGSNGMLGHFPKGPTGPVTGRAQEAGVDYWSPDGYLYIALWASASTFIEIDMRAAPPEA